MKIRGLILPQRLIADLNGGGLELREDDERRLFEMLPFGAPAGFIPQFYRVCDVFCLASRRRLVDEYKGQSDPRFFPGDVEPKRTLVIGQIEPESPIALDYRVHPPRVICFSDIEFETHWLTLAEDYATFRSAIKSNPF